MAQCSDLTQNTLTSRERRRRSSIFLPPLMRIVLLGKDVSGNSRVVNFMLGRSAFESESPPDDHHCCERVRGTDMTLINCPHLLQPNLSSHHITQTVRECVYLSHPGPHVIILILQHHDFSQDDKHRVKNVLNCFSDQAMKRTIVLTTDEETYDYMCTSVRMNECIIDLIKECGGGHLQFDEDPACLSEMFRTIYEILSREPDEYLKCEISGTSVDPELMVHEYSLRSEEDDSSHKHDENPTESHKEGRDEENVQSAYSSVSVKSKLNVVLCGPDSTLKVIMSKLLRGKMKKTLTQREFTSVCVKKEEKVHRRLISVVELPALTGLSDEEMMCQTLTAVSLCHPGVHVFLIIVPVGPLTDKNKEEIEKIQKFFYSREHFMMIFMSDVPLDRNVTEFVESYAECQRFIRLCRGQYRVIGLKEHETFKAKSIELLYYIENMKTEPYSLHMYARAQEMRGRQETEEKYEEKLREMTSKIKELQLKISSYGAEGEQEDLKGLRIVLIGKTGSGKSATGNTILSRKQFESKSRSKSVTTVCEKGVGEVDGRSVAVVDTPGLFDTTLLNEQVIDEIMKCVSLSSPGPHVFIIVLSLGRFTREESDTVNLIKKIFGHKAAQFTIVLFTRGDDLKDESIEDFVKDSSEELKKLIRDCGNRFLVFNNNETQDRTQVTRLINMIEGMKTTNQGRYFTNSMFEEAEMSIKKKMEEILKEKEREILVQREELTAKYEMEKENMMKRLEEEKRRAEEKKVQIEKNFREQEETLRKEFEEKEESDQQKRELEKQKQLEEEKQQRAEYHQKIEDMKREIEHQRSLYEQQQREREEDDKKRDEKYRQDQEEMKREQEQIITELQKKQEEETKKRESEEQKRREQEEREREEWRRKMKEAENDRQETQEEIKRQQREWEEDKKQQMREQVEDERMKRERHEEQLREKQEELEKMRQKFEKEKEERRQRDEERQKLRQEKEEKEREYEEKKNEMVKHYEQLERERKEMWERKQREYDERKEEERKRWKKIINGIKREQEEEIKRRETQERERKEREEKEREEIKKEHERRIKEMKKKHEDEARKQAEELNEFREKNEQHVQELKQMLEERQKQEELLKNIYHLLQNEKTAEVKKLKKQIEELQRKSKCFIM